MILHGVTGVQYWLSTRYISSMTHPFFFFFQCCTILNCFFFFLLKKNLFFCTRSRLQHAGSLIFIAACGSLNYTFGVKFPDRGLNLGPLHWEYGVLATGPLGKTLGCFFSNKFLFCIVTCYPSGECIEFPYSMKVCKWKY